MALRWVPTQLSGASRQRFALHGSAIEKYEVEYLSSHLKEYFPDHVLLIQEEP